MKQSSVLISKICVLLSLMFLFCLSFAVFAQNGLHYKEALRQIKENKEKMTPVERKINGHLLKTVQKMTSENAMQIKDSIQVDKAYSTGFVRVDKEARIYIKIILKRDIAKSATERFVNALQAPATRIVNYNHPDNHIKWMPEIYCWMQYSEILKTAEDNMVTHIGPVMKPIRRIGDFTTPGDTQLKAQQARNQYYVDGSGYSVGVISDGVDNWTRTTGSGDLDNVTNITINGNRYDSGDEGTAMLEIIHDIAPGADLYFAGIGAPNSNPGIMESAIQLLFNSHGCKIVVDDWGWYDVPYFEDNSLNQTIAYQITENNKTYISACGNDATSAWGGMYLEAQYEDEDWHVWDSEGGGEVIANRVTMQPNDSITVLLQWADDWDNSTNDYDIFLMTYDGIVIASANDFTFQPSEALTFRYTGASLDNFYIRILKYDGIAKELKVFVFMNNENNNRVPADIQYTYDPGIYSHPVNQIFGHPAAPGVISVAAYPAYNEDVLENFSSRGPTRIYADSVFQEERKTPTITATDSIETKIGSLGYFGQPFFGTSAAAPHIAGIAALYYEEFGNVAPENFTNALTSTAATLGNIGNGGTWNPQSGYGKADALQMLGGATYTDIIVNQVNASGDSISTFAHWEGSSWQNYTPPDTFTWDIPSTHYLLANQNIVTGEKYKWWNENESHAVNHRRLNVNNNTGNQIAYFAETKNAELKTFLISANGDGDIEVGIKDPWLPDENEAPYGMKNRGLSAIFHDDSTPLDLSTGSSYKGVFKNQNPAATELYYEVRAPKEATIDGNLWYFTDWSATGANVTQPNNTSGDYYQSPVVFTQDNAEVTTNYKGHLLSTTYTATAANNSRRTIHDNNGDIHLVYEDNGHIYYTWSPDNGQTWNRDLKLSGMSAENHHPTLCLDSGEKITVVWERVSGGTHYLSWRHFFLNGQYWSAELTDNFIYTSLDPIKPAAVYHRPDPEDPKDLYVLVTIYNSEWVDDGLYLLTINNAGQIIGAEQVPGTNQYSQNPALAIPCEDCAFHGSGRIYITWEQQDQEHILYTRFNMSSQSFSKVQNISAVTYGMYQDNRQPTLATDRLGYINIAWVAFNSNTGRNVLLHKKALDDQNWYYQPITEFYSTLTMNTIANPSIGALLPYDEESPYAGWFNLAFNSNSLILPIQYQNGSWQWISAAFTNGVYPNLNGVSGSDHFGFEDIQMAWTASNTSAPYQIEHQTLEAGQQMRLAKGENIRTRNFREERFDLDSLQIHGAKGKTRLQLGEIQIATANGKAPWRLQPLPQNLNHSPFMQTESLTITAGMNVLIVHYELELRDFVKPKSNPQTPLFKLRLLKNKRPVATLRQVRLDTLNQSNLIISDSVAFDLTPLIGDELVLQCRALIISCPGGEQC